MQSPHWMLHGRQALIRLALPTLGLLQDVGVDFALESPRWRGDEAYTQGLGVHWLSSNQALWLWVPSFIEPQERNRLLNPAHPLYAAITVITEIPDFRFAPRLF